MPKISEADNTECPVCQQPVPARAGETVEGKCLDCRNHERYTSQRQIPYEHEGWTSKWGDVRRCTNVHEVSKLQIECARPCMDGSDICCEGCQYGRHTLRCEEKTRTLFSTKVHPEAMMPANQAAVCRTANCGRGTFMSTHCRIGDMIEEKIKEEEEEAHAGSYRLGNLRCCCYKRCDTDGKEHTQSCNSYRESDTSNPNSRFYDKTERYKPGTLGRSQKTHRHHQHHQHHHRLKDQRRDPKVMQKSR